MFYQILSKNSFCRWFATCCFDLCSVVPNFWFCEYHLCCAVCTEIINSYSSLFTHLRIMIKHILNWTQQQDSKTHVLLGHSELISTAFQFSYINHVNGSPGLEKKTNRKYTLLTEEMVLVRNIHHEIWIFYLPCLNIHSSRQAHKWIFTIVKAYTNPFSACLSGWSCSMEL